MNTITKPFDGTGQTVNSIVSLIITHYNNDNQAYHGGHARREDYYCGITNDIPSNLSRHGIEGYVFCIECASYAVSSKAEEMLDVEGFDIGAPPPIGRAMEVSKIPLSFIWHSKIITLDLKV